MKYRVKEGNIFVRDMEKAGLRVTHYEGRWAWAGPSVSVKDLQEALHATKVSCRWEILGFGWVVYPRVNCGVPLQEGETSIESEGEK